MIGVIFEVHPASGRSQEYLDLAAALKDELLGLEGFISIERFESLSEPGKLLSLSFFRDEAAVKNWRNLPQHRATQSRGRRGIFDDYRLRVVNVIRDYGLNDRTQAPRDSRTVHDQSAGGKQE
tara:strand:- start:2497 stop:2865 length:369 start_codon:yes stop_codon:yes gene_type:complete